MSNYQEIVNLNIGGTRFSTSWHTLTWVPDTFFTALLSGRIPTVRDETGAIFIDRDPNLFGLILNFLRTRDIDLNNVNIRALRHECDYFGITPLSRRLALCDEMNHSSCGDVLFHGYLPPPLNGPLPNGSTSRCGTVSRKNSTASNTEVTANRTHSRNSSLDLRAVGRIPSQDQLSRCGRGHSRAASLGNTDSHKGLRPPEGTFNLGVRVEHLLFVGPQLVALSGPGSRSKAGVWHTSTQHWQTQDVAHLTTHDTAGSFLLLGTATGAINYIDMQKFPLRMKDNDLLVTQLYKDPNQEPITAISVYLTPKTNLCGNWIEIAYGTRYGSVRVIVQHPETVGHGPQLFQTFTVHQSPVTKVSLSENYLISVCSEYNHVRSWRVTRFRGMISTQPGTTPKAAFKVLALEAPTAQPHNDCGPYGEQDEEQIFIQKVVPDTDTLYVRLASNGKRVCTIRSVDGSAVSCFVVVECEGALRPRRLLLCGHRSGAAQMWDLTAHIDRAAKPTQAVAGGNGGGEGEESPVTDGGPSPDELVRLLSACDLDATPAPPVPSSPNRPIQAP
ncbi:hypothetical protein KGM_202336 [Danaus plexippus plexippus]|uniref:Uncharacterized protein n=1 Tax=Danaus plexippus plexippus TaxID=278856 RepID=A0A212EVT6_DANPL|nr:BTB/POZ domain-containing protein KCTD3 [Danaus plexippus plexippus]OWR45596.1 hypothetical protein KGM_202336 [Danaus plexippus plexippus]